MKVKCVVCGKKIDKKDAVIQMYVPFCKDCADKKKGFDFEDFFI